MVLLVAGAGALRDRGPHLTPLEQRIVTLATSQLGYRTTPVDSYCNRFSAYWRAGGTDCPAGTRNEEWCADFASWVWHRAGAEVVYGYADGELNAASFSFYQWGVAHHTWHQLGSRYVPRPGDVAVYGLDLTADTAQHVAVVVSVTPGMRGPDVVNGDGSRTGFSVVEMGTDQYSADIHGRGELLAGYVSPSVSVKRAPRR